MMKLLTIRETAKLLSLSEDTVRRMIDRREIATHKIGRSVRIPQSAIDRLLTSTYRKMIAS